MKVQLGRLADAGYEVFEGLVSPTQCDRLLAALSRLGKARGPAGARHLMRVAEIGALARDPRLLRIVEAALGGAAVPFRATLFAKTGRANWLIVWHQDTALPLQKRFSAEGWGPWSTKQGVPYAHAPAWALERILALRLHLDASTNCNGPLRVIAGSHKRGLLSDEEIFRAAQTAEATECLVGRGGVLAMRPLLIHSSSKARLDQPRRVIHIEYADSLQLDHEVRLAVV